MNQVSFLASWFSFGGRINRRSYLCRLIAIPIVLTVCFWGIYLGLLGGSYVVASASVLMVMIASVSGLSLVVRRLHDLAVSGWWATALLLYFGIANPSSFIFGLLEIWITPVTVVLVVLGLIPGRASAIREAVPATVDLTADNIERNLDRNRDRWQARF